MIYHHSYARYVGDLMIDVYTVNDNSVPANIARLHCAILQSKIHRLVNHFCELCSYVGGEFLKLIYGVS